MIKQKRYTVLVTNRKMGSFGKPLLIRASVVLEGVDIYNYTDDWENFTPFGAEEIADLLNDAVNPLYRRISELEKELGKEILSAINRS